MTLDFCKLRSVTLGKLKRMLEIDPDILTNTRELVEPKPRRSRFHYFFCRQNELQTLYESNLLPEMVLAYPRNALLGVSIQMPMSLFALKEEVGL